MLPGGAQEAHVALNAREEAHSVYVLSLNGQKEEVNVLEQVCSDKSLAMISKQLADCDTLWPFLGISYAKHEEVVRNNFRMYENYKLSLLLEWRNNLGVQATYQKLSEAFEEWGNQDISADVLKKISSEVLKVPGEQDTRETTTTLLASSPATFLSSLECSGSLSMLHSYESFESDPHLHTFTDMLDNISDAIAQCYDTAAKISKLIIKVNAMLNSNKNHNVPRHVICELGRKKYKHTDELFCTLSPYIKPGSTTVLQIIVDASGCKKAQNLLEEFLEDKNK